MPYDFPTTPATGTVVTVPDGSYRVWDSQKWRAAPSGASIYPPGSQFLPLAGGTVTGDAAAAAAGVPLNGWYRNGSVMMQRVA
jgi:hypothetical protein